MSDEQIPFRPNRSFTKRMLIANNLCAWGAIFVALYLGAGVVGIVIPAMSTYLFALFSAYVGVGHLDMRASAALAGNPNQGGQQ